MSVTVNAQSQLTHRKTIKADRTLRRLSATLLFVGELLSLLVGLLHPAHEDPNNHSAVFAEYAASANWTAIHLGQFAGMAVIILILGATLLSMITVALVAYGSLRVRPLEVLRIE